MVCGLKHIYINIFKNVCDPHLAFWPVFNTATFELTFDSQGCFNTTYSGLRFSQRTLGILYSKQNHQQCAKWASIPAVGIKLNCLLQDSSQSLLCFFILDQITCDFFFFSLSVPSTALPIMSAKTTSALKTQSLFEEMHVTYNHNLNVLTRAWSLHISVLW